jgi:mannose-6-phosphate isomerase-like protein (cupin superfamily)
MNAQGDIPMGIAEELIDSFPPDSAARVIQRREELLLAEPLPGPMKLWKDAEPLEVVHFGQEYEAQPFAPPRGLYESDFLRVEWQTMDNRQPFYHRNCDVDEISYQIAGDRTLMTELGTVEHGPGELSRIPAGVAHDNYGRRESHLLFYVPAPVEEVSAAEVQRTSDAVFPPFEGWVPKIVNELVTECLGGPGHDVAIQPVDERLLLEQVHKESDRIAVLAVGADIGTSWIYRSAQAWLGTTRLAGPGDSVDRAYRRHRAAEEIQYQISGRRTLVSQRGVVELEPGDFVRIPLGCAFTSVTGAESVHITLLSARPVPQVAAAARKADPVTPDLLAQIRNR